MDDSHDEGGYFWDEGCVEFGMNPWNRAKWNFTYGVCPPIFFSFPLL